MCCIGSLMLNMLGDFPNSHKKLRSIMTSKTMSMPIPVRIPIPVRPYHGNLRKVCTYQLMPLFSDFDYPAQKLLKKSDKK